MTAKPGDSGFGNEQVATVLAGAID